MLRLRFANRFDTLADLLVGQIGHGGSVLAADPVIVPSAAVQRWLTLAVARRHGVCANVGFSYLAHWLWQQMRQVLPAVPATSPLEPALMAWRLYAAFGDAEAVAAHPRLAAYLGQADAVMRHELAQRIAGLFDQYRTYRPQWLQAWTARQPLPLDAAQAAAAQDAAWQAALWCRLTDALPELQRDAAPAFEQALQQRGRALVEGGVLPPRAHVFCLPTMPPAHLALLQALGQVMDLELYALNPCREYWFDVVDRRRLSALAARGDTGHSELGQPLLAAWGRQAQSQLGLLVDACGDGIVDDDHYQPHPGSTLLARLHNAILDLADPPPGSVQLADDDRSIEVHLCHSRTRELEVLQDRLLGLLAGPDAPPPEQIVVVTPDLEATAPLIEAVFGTAPRERFIPFTISGRARSRVNGIARALLQLLALAGSRCAATEVSGLLQQPCVARRFGLDDEALDRVHGWLQDAGVHWALDADHRASLGLPAQARHSFADGLERLHLGYALPEGIAEPFGSQLPAGPVEGSAALVLGALGSFVQRLQALRRRLLAGTPAPDWPALLGEALEGFIAAAADELEDWREVQAAVQRLALQFSHSGLDERLPLDVVRAALAQLLDDPARGGVPTGAVTFSSMSSLRHIPYRVVCVIGLDDGAFPTANRPPEFDLMALHPRPGDRQRRSDERNLFLDLVLAAQDQLHLSCVGRSVRDNAVMPPSVLISELLEALAPWLADPPQDAAALARAHARLVVEHPLQAFAERSFRRDSPLPLRSFHREYCEALQRRAAAAAAMPPPPAPSGGPAPEPADADSAADDASDDTTADDAGDSLAPFFGTPLPAPGDEWREISLPRLIEFFRQPCRFLLRRRLGLELRSAREELADDEAFVPDVPSRSALAERLLPVLLQRPDLDAARRLALAGTDWPTGAFGREWLERELQDLAGFAAGVSRLTGSPVLPPQAITLTLDVNGQPWRLQAGFADLRAGGLVRHRYDDARPADHLSAWLQHLLLCAGTPAGVAPVTTWLARDGAFRFGPVAAPAPVLQALLALVDQGLRRPLYFFPKSAWAYVMNDDSVSLARQAWRGGFDARFAEGRDPACRLALRGLPDPLAEGFDEFARIAHAVLDPLRDALAAGDTP